MWSVLVRMVVRATLLGNIDPELHDRMGMGCVGPGAVVNRCEQEGHNGEHQEHADGYEDWFHRFGSKGPSHFRQTPS